MPPPTPLPAHATSTAAPPRVAAVLGPTGAGKTALALALHRRGMPVDVICCDATQLIAGLDAATAKPTAAERAAVRHYLVDAVEADAHVDAARYAALALDAIADVGRRGRWPLLVGGTGLYHRALVVGLAAIPTVPPAVRIALAKEAESVGLDALWRELSAADPDYAAITPAANRQRLLRALEVLRATGRPFSAWHREAATPPLVRSLDVVLEADPTWLAARLEVRARAMAPALLREVDVLRRRGVQPIWPALQALGYPEAFALRAEVDAGRLAAAAAEAQLATTLAQQHRAYAKRQRTWFRRLDGAVVVDARTLASDDLQSAAALGDLCERLVAHFTGAP